MNIKLVTICKHHKIGSLPPGALEDSSQVKHTLLTLSTMADQNGLAMVTYREVADLTGTTITDAFACLTRLEYLKVLKNTGIEHGKVCYVFDEVNLLHGVMSEDSVGDSVQIEKGSVAGGLGVLDGYWLPLEVAEILQGDNGSLD